ncbi:hypothetical protein BGW38_000527 [Lunasporangiospora selenospora]|uniref:MI domain-containing protein n=1 Tax=Lunasporangiospora selenospora TaxID=979761 RepID=A0A9P6KEW6_9FUNG|nr:hypothetical protein BGW38_000527 [Lunasporangiospora selenospora]
MNHPPGRVNSVQPSVQQYGPYHHHPTPSMWQAQYYTGQYDYDYYSQPPMMYQAAPSYTYMSPQPPPAQNRGLNTNAPTFTPRPALPSKKVAIINPATNREVNPIVPTGSLIEANGSNIVKSPSVIDMRKPDTSKEKDVIKTAVQSKQKGDPKVGDITEHSDGENKEDVAQNEAVARVLEDETKQQQLVMEEADQRAKEESDRLECEEKDLREQEEAEQKRLEQEQKESQEREEMEHREKEERERFEKERLEKERLEMERLENERLEKERLEISLLEKERFEKEQLEKERVLKEQLEKEQLEKEQLEKEQLEKEQLEKDQLEKDQLEKGKFEKEKIEREEQEHHETTEKQRVELAERNFLVVNETETLVKETEQQQSIDGTQIQFVRQDRHGSIGVDSDAQGTITEDKARRESVSGTREWPAVNNRQDSSQSSSGDQGSALFTDGRRSSSPPISRDPSRIDNFNNVTYPTMTRSPPIRDTDGRIRYSRDFLMQFKDICKSKPASYRVLQAYGVINPEPERRVSISSEPMYGQRSGAPQGGRSGSISERVIEPYKLDTALARSGRSISHDQRFPPAKLGRSPSYQALTPRGDPLSRTPSYRTSKGPRGGGQVRGNDRGRQELVSPILSEYAPLVKTENAWAPKLSAGKSLSDSFASEPVTQEMITRKVKALLNKLTKDNIESISGQVIEIANFSVKESDGTTLKHCIHLIFEKATDEPGFGSVYASLCAKMLQEISSDVKDEALPGSTGGKLFRKYLLSICQEEFERGWKDKASLDGVSLNDKDGPDLMSDEYYVMMKAKRQGLGLIRFIGELYKQKMLTEKIMHECVKKLLANVTNPEEEETEGLCKLMTTIGALLDRPEAKGHMDVYFVRMQELTKSSKLSSRVRFLVQDVIDMRANNWVSRREVSGPKTIAEIHEQAAREHQEQEMMRRTTSSSGRGLPTRREQMSRGPSFRNDYPFPQSPNKKMDLSNFGNTTRSKANDMTFEPASAVFGAFSKSKRPAPSSAKRPSQVGLSNVNTFAALQDFDDHKAETTKPTLTERPKLNIAPRTIPSPESEPVAKSLIDPKPEPKKTEEQAVRSISNTLKEYLSLRDMEELLVSIDELDRCYIPLLVTEFVNQSIVMKRENVDQVAEAFKSLRNQNRITSADFEKGFEVPLKDLGDTAIDVPNAYTYAGMLLEAAGLDPSKAVKPSDPLQLWGKRVGPLTSSTTANSRSHHGSAIEDNSENVVSTTSGNAATGSPPSGTTTEVSRPEPHIDFVVDETLNSQVLELLSPNLISTFITTPALATRTLGIKLPFLVFLVKNLGKYWSFEVMVLDDRGEKRRFRASNFQSTTRVKPYITTMPLRMDPGWNQIQLNLADYTKRAYGTAYVETLRITIHANCRLRRVFFSDRLVSEDELPAEFKLYLPVVKQ